MTHEQEEEREAMLETRAKGKRDDDRIERDEETVKRFLRGGYKSATFPSGQLLTDDEHEVVCAHILAMREEISRLDYMYERDTEILKKIIREPLLK
jgi:hypothetical protein